ncbi:hypothetical protein HU200_054173 [Digitaria exilis]|uniref:Cytochrome b561 domain-containing protein n=1 Tax=Digitaria exilis TaxID=1010633 RepID=A0A835E7Q5_9POAL|nr:hypothetical protein HU200_054173 [Digitaria exilis]
MARITRSANRLATRQCTPRPPHVLVVALCLASSYLPSASSQSAADSCSNALSLGSLVPFNTTGLACFQAWPSQDFILRVSALIRQGGGEQRVELRAVSTGQRRVHRDRVLADRADGGEQRRGRVGRRRRRGLLRREAILPRRHELQLVSAGPGKLALVAAAPPTVVSKGSRLYLAFQLAGQPLTDVVYAVAPPAACRAPTGSCRSTRTWRPAPSACPAVALVVGAALPPAALRYKDSTHAPISFLGAIVMIDSRAWVEYAGDGDDDGGEGGEGKSKRGDNGDEGDEGKGARSTSPASSSTSGTGAFLSAKRRHGVLAVVSWGVLVPSGVAFARFLKRFDPFWFYAHAVAQGIGFVVGVLAVVAGFRLGDDDEVAAHKAIAWSSWSAHACRVAVALGVANVFYGLSLANERQEWSYVYGVFIGIFAVVYLVLEEWRRRH